MTPETADTMAAADQDLVEARGNLSLSFYDQAARMAYYARFHAAQAMIFEVSGKVAKTHKGVHREFHRLAMEMSSLPPGLAAELTQTYKHKEIADYDTARRGSILPIEASDAIATAERFVDAVRKALTAP